MRFTGIGILLSSVLLAGLTGSGCRPSAPSESESAAEADSSSRGPASSSVSRAAVPIRFRAQELPFQYNRGESGNLLPVEPTGGGVGLLDFDGDGDLDIFFAQGVPLPPRSVPDPPSDVLLRNDGGGKFTDISKEAGLTSRGYGMGVSIADYDGDGHPDVFVSRYGTNTLWRNDGKGHFTDVAAEAGLLGKPSWSLGAAFADFDGDGDLDLFVANYFFFDPAKAPFQFDFKTGAPMFGPPSEFPSLPDVLYRNDGKGHFTDVTESTGVAGMGRGMGVLAADFDGDGRMDILVANDADMNTLWHNNGDMTFTDVALERGLAVNETGATEANMGIARGDTDSDGLQDVLITHFYGEHDTLWRAVEAPAGLFYHDATGEAGMAVDSMPLTGWGTSFADFDQDGCLDLIVSTGHIRPEPQQLYKFECPPIFWQGTPEGRMWNVTAQAGPYFLEKHMGRGLAVGDLDGDGDLDVVIVHHFKPAVVLWNETPGKGHHLKVELQGTGMNRDAIGAIVTAHVGRRVLVRSVDGGGGYLSSNERRLHFGLGTATAVDRLDVRWPSGKIETREHIPADSVARFVEGR